MTEQIIQNAKIKVATGYKKELAYKDAKNEYEKKYGYTDDVSYDHFISDLTEAIQF